LTKRDVIEKMNMDIVKKEAEVSDMKKKMETFERHFGKYFASN